MSELINGVTHHDDHLDHGVAVAVTACVVIGGAMSVIALLAIPVMWLV